MHDVLSCVRDPDLGVMSARRCGVVMISLEEAIADKARVLLQARTATSQRPNHTRQSVCKTQAENVFAVCLTEAAGSRMNQRDRSESGLQGTAVRLIKVYLLACAHVNGSSVGSFGRKS
jgi:hypothetical protein